MARAATAQGDSARSSHSADGLLTIINTKHRDVLEEKVRVLFVVTCGVVTQEFHRDFPDVEFASRPRRG